MTEVFAATHVIRTADVIAADFLTIPFEDHEAKILAHAYFALKRRLDEPLTCATCGDSMAPLSLVSSPASVFPAGGASVGEKNLRVGQPGHSRIMDRAIKDSNTNKGPSS